MVNNVLALLNIEVRSLINAANITDNMTPLKTETHKKKLYIFTSCITSQHTHLRMIAGQFSK